MALLQSYLFLIKLRYINSDVEIPIEVMNWSPPNYSSPILNATSALICIHVHFMQLLDTMRDTAFNIDAEEVVQAALLIDTELNDWEAGLPGETWSFDIKESNQVHDLYQGKYHVYRSIWASRVLNHYRWARILINEVIILSISKLATSSSYSQFKQQALATISRITTDICVSAPSFFRLLGSGLGSSASGEDDPPPIDGVFLLLFSLIIAGSAIGISDELHDWIVKIMGIIASSMGIRHAAQSISIVKLLRQAKQSENSKKSSGSDTIGLVFGTIIK